MVVASTSNTNISKELRNENENGKHHIDLSSSQSRLFVPMVDVTRIMRCILPPEAKISVDSREIIQEYVSKFISHITQKAKFRSQQLKRRTIMSDDIIWAIEELGFINYVAVLTEFKERYIEIEHGGSSAYKRSSGEVEAMTFESLGIGHTGPSEMGGTGPIDKPNVGTLEMENTGPSWLNSFGLLGRDNPGLHGFGDVGNIGMRNIGTFEMGDNHPFGRTNIMPSVPFGSIEPLGSSRTLNTSDNGLQSSIGPTSSTRSFGPFEPLRIGNVGPILPPAPLDSIGPHGIGDVIPLSSIGPLGSTKPSQSAGPEAQILNSQELYDQWVMNLFNFNNKNMYSTGESSSQANNMLEDNPYAKYK